MPKFITDPEVARLRAAAPGSLQAQLYAAFKVQILDRTRYPGLKQPDDVNEWWYLTGRLASAAFLWYVERDEKLAEWIRNAAFWIRDQEDTEWIGPWFRDKSRPLIGMLETAGMSIALCKTLDMAAELFTKDEILSLEEALRVKGMEACKRYCDQSLLNQKHINNFFNVIVSGYGTCALYFGETDAALWTAKQLSQCYALYNKDCYAETLHYSDYASSTLADMNELMLRACSEAKELIDLSCYTRMMDWYASNFLYMKPWEPEQVYPRFFSSGDSGGTFRPAGNFMAHIAVRMKDEMPRQAALASWLFHTTYQISATTDVATLNKIAEHSGNFGYYALLMMPDMAAPKSPAELGMDTHQYFENGELFLRDSWENTRGAMAVQSGYGQLNVCSHRHQDLGSFQLVVGKERMIADGATSCYRLHLMHFTRSTCQHSTVDFLREPEPAGFNEATNPFAHIVPQLMAEGNFRNPKPPRITNLTDEKKGNAHVLVMDMTHAYPEEVTIAKRALITALPHAVFIIDQAETAEPLRMRTHFPVNNRDNKLNTHRADEHRYVFRRNGEAMKVFECEAYLDGEKAPSKMEFDWGYMHRHQTIPTNREGQAKEGSMEIYNWVDQKPCKKHLRICAIAADRDEFIKGWHIKPDQDGNWYIESPQKEKWLTVKAENGHVYLIQDGLKKEIL